MLQNGADIEVKETSDGERALHVASREGYLDVVQAWTLPCIASSLIAEILWLQVLVDAGASKSARDDNGNRPEDVVCNGADPPCTSSTRRAIANLVDR